MSSQELVRSFIAIEIPEEVKALIAQLQEDLKSPKYTFVKWVDPEGIHLTLKFLGNIPQSKIQQIKKVMEETVHGIPPFQLGIGKLGTFPSLKRPRVLWVSIEGETDKLLTLQQRLEANLTPLGFTPESRSFTPHLTLARLREGTTPKNSQDLGERAMSLKFEAALSFAVESLVLMKSLLTPRGAIYTPLARVKLE